MNEATIDHSTLKVILKPAFVKMGKGDSYEYFEGFNARVNVGYSDSSNISSSSLMAESYTSQVKAQVSLHSGTSANNDESDGKRNEASKKYVVKSNALDSATFSTLESTWIIKTSDISSSNPQFETNRIQGTNLSFEIRYQVRSNPAIDLFVRNTFSMIAEKQVAAFIRRGEEEEETEKRH